jgi:hypothetical protein
MCNFRNIFVWPLLLARGCTTQIWVVSSMFFFYSCYLTNCLNPTVHSRSCSFQRGTLSPLLLLCPNHTMSSFSQAGSSTIHTMTSSPQHLRSSCTNVSLHAYLCCITFSVFHGFCYIVRRKTLIEDDIAQLQDVLRCFHRPAPIYPYWNAVALGPFYTGS